MSEIILGGSRFDDINSHAFWANAHLDTRLRLDKDFLSDNYNHLQDCINHPTTGLLAAKKNRTYNYPSCYNRNLKDLKSIPSMRDSFDRFETKFSKLYPKTGRARKFLINNESIVLNYVKPIKRSLKRILFRYGLG